MGRATSYADIIVSVAWTCGEKDCPAQWHQANYWTEGRGYTVDWYSDGDHETVTKREIPSAEEADQSWREYAAHVLETGTDPLGQYLVRHTVSRRERWRFHLVASIVGVVCCEARHAGRTVYPQDFPDYIRDYLNIDPKVARPICRDFATMDEAREVCAMTRDGWVTGTFGREVPRSVATVARELRRAARKRLRGR